MYNEKLSDIAEKVRQTSNIPEDEEFGSVIAVIMIIGIILSLIRVIQECNKTKSQGMTSADKYNFYGTEIRHYSTKRGWFTKLRIKKLLRQRMSRDQYSKYSIPLLNALLTTGENLTDEQIVTLVENANV